MPREASLRFTPSMKRRPACEDVRVAPGTIMIIYATMPIMAVVGTARVTAVDLCDADIAWQRHHERLGLERAEFDSYLDGGTAFSVLHRAIVSSRRTTLRPYAP